MKKLLKEIAKEVYDSEIEKARIQAKADKKEAKRLELIGLNNNLRMKENIID